MAEEATKKKFDLLDMSGTYTGWQMNRARWQTLILCVAVYFLCVLIVPYMGLTVPKAGMALGLVFATIVLWVSNVFTVYWGGLVLAVGGCLLGLFSFSQVQSTAGSSNMLQMFGFYIVAEGALSTNVGKRIGYFCIYKFNQNMSLMVLSMFVATMVLSIFCSNIASTVVMCGIAAGLLKEVEETDPVRGKLLGKSMVIMIAMGAMLGGIVLPSSSPGQNTIALNALAAANNGVTIEFGQWAVYGMPSALILLVPTWLIYIKLLKLPKGGVDVDQAMFKKKLDDIGPITGAEVRWVLTVVLMVVTMITGMLPTNVAATTFAVIATFPMVGSVNIVNYFKAPPFGQLLQMCFNGLIGVLFINYGIDKWMAGVLVPMLQSLSPFMLMIVCALTVQFINAMFPNANSGIITICVTIFAPVIFGLGLNPLVILAPQILNSGLQQILGVQMNMYITYKYGYWEINEPILPGVLSCIMWCVVTSIVVWFLYPMTNLSLYV